MVAVLYKNISINLSGSFGGDATVDPSEAGATGFTIAGSGEYKGVLPSGPVPVILTFPGGITQTFNATFTGHNTSVTPFTFTWSLTDTNMGSTALPLGAETVKVTSFAGNSLTSPTVSFDFACFAAGTHVLTPDGDVPVEALGVGDTVLTEAGVPHPITWIGSWAANVDDPADRAVRIAAGAFGPGHPARDLVVSPKHGIWLHGVSVPAIALVDDVCAFRRIQPPIPIESSH
jgi:hypothetical protein